MTKVDNFRTYDLYRRSVDLTKITYNTMKCCKNNLSRAETNIIRKKVFTIPREIATGIAQVNISIRFNKLNKAKVTLNQLRTIIDELYRKGKIDSHSWVEFDSYSIETMKLFNGYFGWMGENKDL